MGQEGECFARVACFVVPGDAVSANRHFCLFLLTVQTAKDAVLILVKYRYI